MNEAILLQECCLCVALCNLYGFSFSLFIYCSKIKDSIQIKGLWHDLEIAAFSK